MPYKILWPAATTTIAFMVFCVMNTCCIPCFCYILCQQTAAVLGILNL